MAIESMNYLAEKARQEELERQQKQEQKTARDQEKSQRRQEKQNQNKDYVTTLNIDGNQSGSRDRAGFFRNFGENAKAVWKDLKDKWKGRREMLRVVPEEDTTKARYESTLRKGEQAVADAESQIKVISKTRETLSDQKKEIEALSAMVKTEVEPAVSASVENKAEQPVVTTSSPEAGADVFSERPAEQQKQLKEVADLIRRAAPLKEGNNALAQVVEAGKSSPDQLGQVMSVIEQMSKMKNLGKEQKQSLEAVAKMFGDQGKAAQYDAKSSEREGLGEVMEAAAERMAKEQNFEDLGQLIIDNNPLTADNKKLGEAFRSGQLEQEDLANGLKAIELIKKMGRWDKKTKETLAKAQDYIEKDMKADNVVSIDQAKAKRTEKTAAAA